MEDVRDLQPVGGLNTNGLVKARDHQFKHPPEVVVSVTPLVTNRSKRGVDLGGDGARNQPGEEFHQSLAHCGIPMETHTRRAKAFNVIGKYKRVEGHDGESTVHADLLKAVIEVNHIVKAQGIKLRENSQ